ncbi:MAG: FprA family A-type flavoprotein [Phycisphaerales bacterium]|nr:MAG: FprA family A-type flavoprotein [Phycisphaerales bacterium]
MQYGIPIVDGIYWVGNNDRRTALFESIWPIPRGVSYNSYLILDEKVVLIDAVKDLSLRGYLLRLKRLLGPDRQIDYLVVNHMEPDHSGAVPILKQMFPAMKIVGNKKTAQYLTKLHAIEDDIHLVADGEELDLGKRKLRFFMTPMVHWPETMMTYVIPSGILFSGDAFGGFGCLEGGIFDDEVDVQYFEDEILRYFSNIVGKYSPMVQNAIEKLGKTEVKIIGPTHGPIWRSNPAHIIDLYDRWSRHDAESGVVLAFGSMYGNTEVMADAVARGLSDAGLKTVRTHNVSTSHISYIIRDIWRYKGLVLGSPTYDAGVFPPMDALLRLLSTKRIAKRHVGVFGSHGWAGGAVKTLTKFVTDSGLDLVEPTIDANFRGSPEQIEQCHALGHAMVRRIRGAYQ